jgi:hypothetical protein
MLVILKIIITTHNIIKFGISFLKLFVMFKLIVALSEIFSAALSLLNVVEVV